MQAMLDFVAYLQLCTYAKLPLVVTVLSICLRSFAVLYWVISSRFTTAGLKCFLQRQTQVLLRSFAHENML